MTEFTSCEDCKNNHDTSICIHCENNLHVTNLFEPIVKKTIDIAKLVGSDVDIEFRSGSLWRIGNLEKINTLQGYYYYKDKETNPYTECRIRQDHWHHFLGNTCPLPEGLEISYRIMFKGKPLIEEHSTRDYKRLNWNRITAFKVIGVADGWKYGWEE